MHAYSDVYAYYIERNQGQLFMDIRDALPGVDEKWFIAAYMKSAVRDKLDRANPKYAALPPGELIDKFIADECGGEYRRGKKWGGFIPEWAGRIYSLYQWQHNIPSARLIELLTLDDMERIYPALHQMGFDAALDKIHNVVLATQSKTR